MQALKLFQLKKKDGWSDQGDISSGVDSDFKWLRFDYATYSLQSWIFVHNIIPYKVATICWFLFLTFYFQKCHENWFMKFV